METSPARPSCRSGARPRIGAAALITLAAAGARAAENEAGLLLFGSLDAGAASFATAGAKLALDRLDRPGFVALASVGLGRRFERALCTCGETARVASLARHTMLGAAVAGYQWFFDRGVAAAFAGPEFTREGLLEARTLHVFSARYGLRLQGEVWARPSAETLVTGTVILGTARGDAWARLAVGYELWGAYLGPEVSLYADATGYRKWNLGLHATDFALGRFNLRASAGLQFETRGRASSPYLALSAWTPL
ncbi:cellulose biosynthesis protein BcsS [Methylobacterium nigriterrae]|uniref:cellulose biosynthesis protein BcsS n=1 Tax=Methylobacterium nigriterrae TaxID=3127512 RepID=UPI00301352FE